MKKKTVKAQVRHYDRGDEFIEGSQCDSFKEIEEQVKYWQDNDMILKGEYITITYLEV